VGKSVKRKARATKSRKRVKKDTPPNEPYWNHRVATRMEQTSAGYKEQRFYFVEAHYHARRKHPHSVTVEAVAPNEASLADLELTLKRMLRALKRPVLRASRYGTGSA
jgi:hypothetical protein